MKNPIHKLELAILDVKLSWYDKLQKKLFLIENGELKLEDYQKEVMNKIFDMKTGIEAIKNEKPLIIKALTIKQPWAGLLVLGLKKNETRSWETKFRGKLAIHSSRNIDQAGMQLLQWLVDNQVEFKPGSDRYNLCTVTGSILGTVEMTDCISTDENNNIGAFERFVGNYEPERYYWTMQNPEIFKEPIPIKGKLNLWNWSVDTN